MYDQLPVPIKVFASNPQPSWSQTWWWRRDSSNCGQHLNASRTEYIHHKGELTGKATVESLSNLHGLQYQFPIVNEIYSLILIKPMWRSCSASTSYAKCWHKFKLIRAGGSGSERELGFSVHCCHCQTNPLPGPDLPIQSYLFPISPVLPSAPGSPALTGINRKARTFPPVHWLLAMLVQSKHLIVLLQQPALVERCFPQALPFHRIGPLAPHKDI